MRSGGNCFHPGSNGTVAHVDGDDLDLDQWRERLGVDSNSIEADPLLDDDGVPSTGSPCLGAGLCWDGAGLSGIKRVASIDMGFEQVTRPKVAGVSVRRMPVIVRRT